MFSGQGSHYYHMGKELFDQHPGFRKWMYTLDTIVCDHMGDSIIQKLYDKNKRRLVLSMLDGNTVVVAGQRGRKRKDSVWA